MEFLDTIYLGDYEIYLHVFKTADANEDKGYVPAYYFDIMRLADSVIVGKCDLRVGHNENTKYGGNIGYEVHEPFRGKRYATKACRLLLQLASMHKMSEVVITCSPENIASRKTCEGIGAEYLGLVDIPEWHEMYVTGRRSSCKYLIKI